LYNLEADKLKNRLNECDDFGAIFVRGKNVQKYIFAGDRETNYYSHKVTNKTQ
jgi:hypothetical protein